MAINSIQESAPAMLDWSSMVRPVSSAASLSVHSATRVPPSLSAHRTDNSAHSTPSAAASAYEPQASIAVTLSPTGSNGLHVANMETIADRYVASVPSPLGTSATGPTMELAAYNLNVKLDAIV